MPTATPTPQTRRERQHLRWQATSRLPDGRQVHVEEVVIERVAAHMSDETAALFSAIWAQEIADTIARVMAQDHHTDVSDPALLEKVSKAVTAKHASSDLEVVVVSIAAHVAD